MKSFLSALTLLCFCLVSWAAAETLTFQALDGDTQEVNPDEIWRIRSTSTSDEPPGAVVIDYAFERVYVKGSLATAAWHRLTDMLASNRLQTGVFALAGLIVIVLLATFRSRPFIRYEFWRASHGLLAIIVAALTINHILAVGTYSAEYPLRAAWLLFAFVAVVAIGLVYFVRPWRMWREDWRVERVNPLADRVWELILRGPDATRLRFKAGQFIWMTLAPNRPPFHDHPFSIASCEADLPRLRLVIREAGDCTNEFGLVKLGTRVAIDGPHGSFVLPEGKSPVVMIAGGVGIAPLLGMLEEAAALGDRSLPSTIRRKRSYKVGSDGTA